MSEMAQTADHLIVLGRGRVVADASVDEVIARASGSSVRVRTPNLAGLNRAIAGPDVSVSTLDDGAAVVTGLSSEQIGDAAASASIAIHELTALSSSLEDAYLSLTADEVEYRSTSVAPTPEEVAR